MTKASQPRAHRERPQPAARSRLGLLEKHSDYVSRARNFRSKQRRLQALQIRAQYKNPNEFAFGMVRGRISQKDGTHRDGPERRTLDTDVVKIMKSQDLSYVRMMKKINEGRLRKLQSSAMDSSASRIQFYDSDDDTQAITRSNSDGDEDKSSERVLLTGEEAEIRIRQERLEKLRIAERELENQRLLLGKGKRKKVGVDDDGVSIFKWASIRKK